MYHESNSKMHCLNRHFPQALARLICGEQPNVIYQPFPRPRLSNDHHLTHTHSLYKIPYAVFDSKMEKKKNKSTFIPITRFQKKKRKQESRLFYKMFSEASHRRGPCDLLLMPQLPLRGSTLIYFWDHVTTEVQELACKEQ
jgi:hypothetical protein